MYPLEELLVLDSVAVDDALLGVLEGDELVAAVLDVDELAADELLAGTAKAQLVISPFISPAALSPA